MTRKIAVSEVSQHATAEDVWIVVNGEVFDTTAFAPKHPGGPESRSPCSDIRDGRDS